MTNFTGSSLNLFTFQLNTTGDIIYTVNFGTRVLSWTGAEGDNTMSFRGSISPTGTVYGTVPKEAIDNTPGPVMVPEINGEKLPQVALLIAGLFLAYRSRKLLKLPSGGMTQPA